MKIKKMQRKERVKRINKKNSKSKEKKKEKQMEVEQKMKHQKIHLKVQWVLLHQKKIVIQILIMRKEIYPSLRRENG